MNFNLFSRLDQLEHELNTISHNQHNIINNVNSQSSHVQHILNEFIKEQSWITPVTMNVKTSDLEKGQAELTFEWQVKELQSGADVVFHYVYGEGEYTSIPAEELQQGLFQVKVPVEIELVPQWEVGFIVSNTHEETKVEEEARRIDEYNFNIIKHFVTVTHQDLVRSSEIRTEHLEHYGTSHYGVIQTNLHVHDGKLNLSLVNHNVDHTNNLLEKASLLKYQNEKLIGEDEIQHDEERETPDDRTRFFYLHNVEFHEDMKYVIKVIFSNGDTFEKEVY